ncbi:MAG TPA: hypothetical protein VM778_05475 [Gemmatimonadota bacterium]|nr:hypothetical protein [Gemmatimonadota bacterium]
MASQSQRIGRVATLCLGMTVLAGMGCDLNDPDELQNSSNYAIVRAQFFASRGSQTPVSGVRMIIESDRDSDIPYRGPDVVAISGEDGVAEARVFPGLSEQQGGDGGTDGQSGTPTDPLELPPPLIFADTAVTLIYNGRIASLIGGGLTIGSGRMYDLGAVYIDEIFLGIN